MSRLARTMLGLTVASSIASVLFLSDIVDVSDIPGLYVVFPLAAVFWGMFLLCHSLEKEVARFDEEQRKCRDRPTQDRHSRSVESAHNQMQLKASSADVKSIRGEYSIRE